MKIYRIGVDLGGTSIKAGLVDEEYKIVHSISRRTNLPRPEHEIEEEIASMCRQLAKEAGIDINTQVASVGIGTPGSVDPKSGIVAFNANFGYHNWHLAQEVQKLVPCKVSIENDANAAAYGEYIAGAARGASCAIVVTLGTGIGGGIIINGKIFSGFNSAGAEIGHTVIVKDGRPCMCGRRGCWEKYASARALTEDTREAMEQHKDNMMWDLVNGDISRVNAKTAFDGMRAGDPLAAQLVQNFAEYIACGITNLINIFQPEIICIGGGVSREAQALLDPIRKVIDAEDYARVGEVKRTKIVTAQLFNDAGIIGAAFLAKQYE